MRLNIMKLRPPKATKLECPGLFLKLCLCSNECYPPRSSTITFVCERNDPDVPHSEYTRFSI